MTGKPVQRVLIIALLLLMAAGFGTATAMIINPPPVPPVISIVSQTDTQITLRVDFGGFSASQVEVDGQTFHVLEIPFCGKMGGLGQPAIPFYGTEIAVPDAKQYLLDYVETDKTILEGAYIYPAQDEAIDVVIDGFPPYPTPPFYIDQAFYDTDQFTPFSVVSIGPAGTLRNVRVLPVKFAAFQFNPVTKELIYYKSIVAKITFSPDEPPIIKLASASVDDSHFQGMYSGLVGYKPAPLVKSPAVQSDGTGAEFLIISDPALKTAADTLAARRNAEGLVTRVVTTTDTGTTAVAIKAYIQTAYDTWSPQPSYLLLLGDADKIPTFYHTVHLSAGPPDNNYPAGFHTGTDLYYAILNGPDAAPHYSEYWTPDLFMGRIPVDDLTQADDVIGKIIEYEDNQWVNGEKGVTMAAYFQDVPKPDGPGKDGFEDRRFVYTSEEIRDFLTGEGFDVDRLYRAEPSVTPTNYNNGDYDSGTAIPADLLRTNGFLWDADTADIVAAINDGRFAVFHRDHGWFQGWGDPYFDVNDVASLTNADHYPVIFSMNCESGWFDSETDEAASTFESLCEGFLRGDDRGAAGVVGATRISSSGWNDNLAKGFVDAIWPAYDNTRGSATPLLRMGEVLNYGKWYMKNVGFPAFDRQQQQYEIFHYYGDPTMEFKIPRENVPPTADANGPYTAVEGSPVQFDGSGSSDPDPGGIALYEWDIDNDGTYDLTGVNPTYTWCDEYSSPVTLKVTDAVGATATASSTVTVTNEPPSIDPIADVIRDEGSPFTVSGSFTDPGCDTWTVTVDYDDGAGPQALTPTGKTFSFTHSYCDNGIHNVIVKVDDGDGGVDTETFAVTVNNVNPAVTPITLDQPNLQFILPGQILPFASGFTDPGSCDTWVATWSFGDATPDKTVNLPAIAPLTADHAYAAPGNYQVKVEVKDDDGGSGSASYDIHVADAAEAKHDLAGYIAGLPDSSFKGNAAQRKNALDNMFRALDKKLETGAYQGFIQDIRNNVRSKADGVGEDWITDSIAQGHICQKIDDITTYVATLKK